MRHTLAIKVLEFVNTLLLRTASCKSVTKKDRCQEGLQLEVGLRRGPRFLVPYNTLYIQVRALVPPKQLLVFEVKEGWAPLCEFLQLPVPDIPFPNINDAGEIRFYHLNLIVCSRE